MADENYDDFFTSGERVPSFKFEGIGTGVMGTILDMQKQQQTDFADPTKKLVFESGEPRLQLRVTLQTDLRGWANVAKIPTGENDQPLPPSEDDGKRRIYIKSDMQRAAREAFAAVGAPGPRVGGKFGVKVSGFKDVGKGNPLSLYEARYQAPSEDAFFQQPTTGQQAPPQQPQYAQPPVQPQYQQPAPPQQPQYAPPAPPQDPWATAPGAPQYAPQQPPQAPQQQPPADPWAAAGAPQQPQHNPAAPPF